MTVWQAIQSRRTVQDYKPDVEIDPTILTEALEHALLAPNHKHTFPWSFILVGRETRAQIAEFAEIFLKEKKPESDEAAVRRSRGKVTNPSALIAFCQKLFKDADERQSREDYASVACAIQNFTLSLAAHDFQCKWSSGRLSSDPKTYELLKVNPEEERIAGFLWVGQPACPIGAQRRPKLEKVLRTMP